MTLAHLHIEWIAFQASSPPPSPPPPLAVETGLSPLEPAQPMLRHTCTVGLPIAESSAVSLDGPSSRGKSLQMYKYAS